MINFVILKQFNFPASMNFDLFLIAKIPALGIVHQLALRNYKSKFV